MFRNRNGRRGVIPNKADSQADVSDNSSEEESEYSDTTPPTTVRNSAYIDSSVLQELQDSIARLEEENNILKIETVRYKLDNEKLTNNEENILHQLEEARQLKDEFEEKSKEIKLQNKHLLEQQQAFNNDNAQLKEQKSELSIELDKTKEEKKQLLENNIEITNENSLLNTKINTLTKNSKEVSENKEKDIINKIIDSCGLNVDSNSNLDQVLSIVKELINKPPIINDKKIQQLENELNDSCNLESVVDTDLEYWRNEVSAKEYGEMIDKCEEADNYLQWSKIRNDVLISRLASQKQEIIQTTDKHNKDLIESRNRERAMGGIIILGLMIVTSLQYKKAKKVSSF